MPSFCCTWARPPACTVTQEGLAIIQEIFTFNSTPDRIRKLTDRIESIRVGTHEGAEVVLGYDFAGSVAGPEPRRIAQVFTSTVAGGGYGGLGGACILTRE